METNEINELDLLEVLSTVAPLSLGYQERLRSQLRRQHHHSKTILLRPGEICRRIYFVSRGLIRVYHIDSSGRERTIIFMGPGELAVDIASFYDQIPATEYLETVQDTVIQSLTWSELNASYADFPEGNYIGRLMNQKYLIKAVNRNIELMTGNLQERYDSLLKNYPNIEQQANQSQIASYLNISRETLSRLKSGQLRHR
ncbi:Crp/Fnr family transcriptional regulator [Pedobacter ureilyticus]|uniref:Crp/Fnr family transcriptional regulator n=1 Tax=Pedobacter ureilyticus TaxID=1393051 RepID=A0ABW9J897_9SPHI|nr:Crp/Fnr family transcriptional regulator [Pedobacter helvus]